VPGGIELDGVVDRGAGERAFQQRGLLGGEGAVVLRASHVDRGRDAIGGQVRARRVGRHR
jgi:hypothetical protein